MPKNHIFLKTLALGMMLSLGGCDAVSGSVEPAQTSEAGLAVIPVTIMQGEQAHIFNAEVAATPEQQARGLMFRSELAPDAAMLFPFSQPKYASFWMENTLISLDMVFIRADGSIDRIAENTVPMTKTPVASGGEVSAVLELAGGTAQRLGLDTDATVSWTLPAQ